LYIHQDAAISLVKIDAGRSVEYHFPVQGNGAYVMVIDGKADIAGISTGKRDATGVWDAAHFTIEAMTSTELLIVDVPMH
jgi:redox-sensitive bicupin YhaK (pirin superfamily)